MERPRQGPIAVLGSSGFIGRHTVAALRQAGHRVRGISRRPAPRCDEHRELDLAACSVDDLVAAFQGCQAVVNVVGIKRERGAQSFQALHVDLVEKSLHACRMAGISRFIHVSVAAARPDGPHAYHRTKWQAEELVRQSGLDWTILRPSVVYGRGDDLVAHLARMVEAAPVFPIVNDGLAPLMPVDVEDVAATVVACLVQQASVRRSIDVVGPERLAIADVVRRVSTAMEQKTAIVPMPAALMRLPVAAMATFAKEPLSTPAQLRMLEEGLVGDGTAMRELLGVAPRPFTPERIRPLIPAPRQPAIDLRLGKRRQSAQGPLPAWLLVLIAAVGVAAMAVAFNAAFWDTWTRLVVALWALGAVALAVRPRAILASMRVNVATTLMGLVAAVVLYAVAWVAVQIPTVAALAEPLSRFPEGHNALFLVATLIPAVVGEELLWRGLLLRDLSTRMPRLASIPMALLPYVAAHASANPLLVAAALGFGLAWSLLYEVTSSLWAVIVCHVVLDLLLVVLLPLF